MNCRDIDDLKAANEALKRESVVISEYYRTLETMTEKLEKDNAALLKTEASWIYFWHVATSWCNRD